MTAPMPIIENARRLDLERHRGLSDALMGFNRHGCGRIPKSPGFSTSWSDSPTAGKLGLHFARPTLSELTVTIGL